MKLVNLYTVKQMILAERDKIPLTVPAALYELVKEKPNLHGQAMRGGIRIALRCMEQCPAIEAKPVVRGEWDVIEDDYVGLTLIKCSVCHEEWCLEGKEEGIDMQLANYNYCPNCGADMRERIET
jgi:hypothetical protein